MPGSFKKRACGADAVTVSETVVNANTDPLLEDDAPRLSTSSAPMLPNVAPATSFANVDSGPTLPVVSQVLTDGSVPTLPTLPAPTLPSPVVASIVEAASAVALEEADRVEERKHPMAHLMPEKIKPSEASLRAAEARAAKKKKAKKVKIIVGVCVLAVTAVVGPPLVRWTIDAVNEAGNLEEDAPKPTTPAADPDDLQATPSAGLDAIDRAEQLVSGTTTPVTP
jgi:hypothetical protein